MVNPTPLFVLLVFCWTLFWSAAAQANLTIRITQGNDQAAPIAIIPFAWQGPRLSEDVARIISDNLGRTGLFNPIARAHLVGLPAQRSEVVFRDWQRLNAQYLVIGQLSAEGESLRITYEVFDVTTGQRLLGESVLSTPAELRGRAHFISDRIYEQLTGQRGIFSTRIAYVTAEPLEGRAAYRYRLHVADADGQRARSVLTSHEPILSPDWSPDGRRLAYVSFEQGRPAIFVQELQTGQRFQLTNFTGLNGSPAWSPDGQRIAMTLSRDASPEIYIYDLEQRRLTRVTHHYAIDTEPAWSPDGRQLIFTSSRSGGPQIYQVTLETGHIQRLTFEGNYNARARYSPDGNEIFMVHRAEGTSVFSIAALHLQTGRTRILTSSPLDESPSVAPNGAMIMYALTQGEQGVLGVVSTDGRIQYELPAAHGDVREPAWSPYLR